MNIQGAELRLKQARETRERAEKEVEQKQSARKQVLKSLKLPGSKWIASRFKLEGALERLKQARALEARCVWELEELQGLHDGGDLEERMKDGEKNKMARSMNRTVEPEEPKPQAIATEAPRKPPCPYCGARNSSVNGTAGATRYRRCGKCGRSFSTVEQVKAGQN